jgi:hypothetical protein
VVDDLQRQLPSALRARRRAHRLAQVGDEAWEVSGELGAAEADQQIGAQFGVDRLLERAKQERGRRLGDPRTVASRPASRSDRASAAALSGASS